MKKAFILTALLFAASVSTFAQAKEANPADVSSPEAIITAVYDVISGDAGKARDWDRFRTLFYKDARLIPSGKNPNTGVVGASTLSPEDYIKRAGPSLERDGFHERELAYRIDRYGNIAQVFSTYLSFRKADDKKPFMRGINSFQLLNDGKRWWIVSIFWQAETPDNLIPKEYEKTRKK